MKICTEEDENAKLAITHYKTYKIIDENSIVECKLETGRTHQIRLHMLSLKHAIVGDKIYCNKYQTKNLENIFSSQCLRSYHISFQDPISQEEISITDNQYLNLSSAEDCISFFS
jgi:23S rRNA pseudouridine1911/1915/1917 synthase